MPIYEYACKDCEKVFESLRAMSEADAPIDCPHCGGRRTKRKMSVCYAESGGRAVAGMNEPSCGACAGGNCASCGH